MKYTNELSGVLFKNDKGGIDSRPDYRGNCEINGEEFWISAWIKTPKKGGDKFMSLSFNPKEAREDYGHPDPKDQDIPF